MLADFALEALPVERADVLGRLVRRVLLLLLGLQPVLKTFEVNETDGACALASDNQRVALLFVAGPANTALHLISILIGKVCGRLDGLGFLKLLLIELLRAHLQMIATEILHSETDTAELDGIEFLDLVVILAGLIFQ